MNLIFTLEEFEKTPEAIFLAGPTRRNGSYELSWRKQAVDILDNLGFDGNVFIPEFLNFNDHMDVYDSKDGMHNIHLWEWKGLSESSKIVFWIPRNIEDGMPAFTTNIEFGYWMGKEPEKVFLGYPQDAERNDYIEDLYLSINNKIIFYDLEELLKYVIDSIN